MVFPAVVPYSNLLVVVLPVMLPVRFSATVDPPAA
jgi:hypothetical protein